MFRIPEHELEAVYKRDWEETAIHGAGKPFNLLIRDPYQFDARALRKFQKIYPFTDIRFYRRRKKYAIMTYSKLTNDYMVIGYIDANIIGSGIVDNYYAVHLTAQEIKAKVISERESELAKKQADASDNFNYMHKHDKPLFRAVFEAIFDPEGKATTPYGNVVKLAHPPLKVMELRRRGKMPTTNMGTKQKWIYNHTTN